MYKRSHAVKNRRHSEYYDERYHLNISEFDDYWKKYLDNDENPAEDIDLSYGQVTFLCGIIGSVIAAIPAVVGIIAYTAIHLSDGTT